MSYVGRSVPRVDARYKAAGRAMFAVQDGFAISGMLMGGEHCVSVAMTEAPDS